MLRRSRKRRKEDGGNDEQVEKVRPHTNSRDEVGMILQVWLRIHQLRRPGIRNRAHAREWAQTDPLIIKPLVAGMSSVGDGGVPKNNRLSESVLG
jgi:hypothetical protein